MFSTIYYYFAGFLLFLASFNALGSGVDIANSIISNQLPSYRLAIEENFKDDADYTPWNKSERSPGITLLPQLGDLNGDNIPDILFVALSKHSFIKKYMRRNEGLVQYYAKNVLLLACHGSENSSYQCSIISDIGTQYPPTWMFSPKIVDVKGEQCEFEGKTTTLKNTAIDLDEVLGSVYRLYWFDGNEYQNCSFGD